MRTYAGAQNIYHRSDYDGDGVLEYCGPGNAQAPSFTCLYSTTVNGQRIELIDEAFAKADLASPNPAPKAGYLFVDISHDGDGKPYDAQFCYGLCAVPAKYRATGLTFIINIQGTVYQKDTGGHPVTRFPADPAAEGWKICE
jgi:hypothetical protein